MTNEVKTISFTKDDHVVINGKKQDWYVREGSYSGTTDDRLGRWYVGSDGEVFRPYGAGHRTRREAVIAQLA